VPDSTSKAEQRQLARQHTTELIAILQGKESAPSSQKPPPSAQPTQTPLATRPRRIPDTPTPPALPVTPPPAPNPLTGVGNTMQRSGSPLNKLVNKTLHLAKLNQVFIALLPTYLQNHATLARLDEKGWVVQTDSSAWATRLRFALPELCEPLEQLLGFELPRPWIRIAPPAIPEPSPPPPRRVQVSSKTVDVLENAAQQFSDPRLGAAMSRLAEHARQRRGNAY